MTELSNQIDACKARRQRFAEAAARINPKPALPMRAVLQAPPMPPKRREYTPRGGEAPITVPIISRIKRAVADEFEMDVEELLCKRRLIDNCIPRYVAIGLMLDVTKMSLPAIGRQLGGRDHTTIINGRNRISKLLESEAFRNRYEQIKAELAA